MESPSSDALSSRAHFDRPDVRDAAWTRFKRLHEESPRVSGEEHHTAAIIEELIREMIPGWSPESDVVDLGFAKLSIVRLPAGNGFWVDLVDADYQENDPFIGIRADLDALLFNEPEGREPRSKVPGVSHACGHDAHISIVLEILLKKAREKRNGESKGGFRFFFQPSEENPTKEVTALGEVLNEQETTGAQQIIKYGGLKDVVHVFGVHMWGGYPEGTLGIGPGAINAAAAQIEITATGIGGHGSRPAGIHPSGVHVKTYEEAANNPEDLYRRISSIHKNYFFGKPSRNGFFPNNIVNKERLASDLESLYVADQGKFLRLANKVHDYERALNDLMKIPALAYNPQFVERMLPALLRDIRYKVRTKYREYLASNGLPEQPGADLVVEGTELFSPKVIASISVPGRQTNAMNAIPGQATYAGTIRYNEAAVFKIFGSIFPESLETALGQMLKSDGALDDKYEDRFVDRSTQRLEAQRKLAKSLQNAASSVQTVDIAYRLREIVYEVDNDDALAALALGVFHELYEAKALPLETEVLPPYLSPGGDDFCEYSKRVPSLLIWAGVGEGDIHSPEFQVRTVDAILSPAKVLGLAMTRIAKKYQSSDAKRPAIKEVPEKVELSGNLQRPMAAMFTNPGRIALEVDRLDLSRKTDKLVAEIFAFLIDMHETATTTAVRSAAASVGATMGTPPTTVPRRAPLQG